MLKGYHSRMLVLLLIVRQFFVLPAAGRFA
jgi:hypothetical protein